MNATETFVAFVTRALNPEKARRFVELATSKKGERKVLDALCYEFEGAFHDSAICNKDYSKLWDKPCYAFYSRVGFGVEFSTVRDAYDALALDDSWLIVLQDASAGIHRPESRWDEEKLIAADSAKQLRQ